MKKHNFKKLKKGFYMNRKTGHPSLVYNQIYRKVKSVGFTSNSYDFASKRQMKRNINPQDNSPCFVKTEIERYQDSDYREDKRFNFYRVHPDDNNLVTQIIKKDGKKPSFRKKRLF